MRVVFHLICLSEIVFSSTVFTCKGMLFIVKRILIVYRTEIFILCDCNKLSKACFVLICGPFLTDTGTIALGTLRHQDTSALNYSAEVSRHFGTDLYETLRHHCILELGRYRYLESVSVFSSVFFSCRFGIRYRCKAHLTNLRIWAILPTVTKCERNSSNARAFGQSRCAFAQMRSPNELRIWSILPTMTKCVRH